MQWLGGHSGAVRSHVLPTVDRAPSVQILTYYFQIKPFEAMCKSEVRVGEGLHINIRSSARLSECVSHKHRHNRKNGDLSGFVDFYSRTLIAVNPNNTNSTVNTTIIY
jgi:hypothetical protein